MTKPFLRWAGGKRKLIDAYRPYLPSNFKVYHEPFIGSGALFFDIKPSRARIADINAELINTYQMVQQRPSAVLADLERHQMSHLDIGGEEYYYQVRGTNTETLTDFEKAARFIYLNATCFNGLYRVNKKGVFNTPYGHKDKPDILPIDTIVACSRVLRHSCLSITTGDYTQALDPVTQGDFVFLDPPYYPLSATSFTSYAGGRKWQHEDHQALALEFRRLVNLGAYVLLANSDCDAVRELYADFQVHTISSRQSIKPGGGQKTEVLIVGGNPPGLS